MKQVILILIACAASLSVRAQGVAFERGISWKAVREKSLSKERYLLVDVNATWCIPCRQMDSITFKNDDLGAFVNSRFISIKVQMDQTKNDDEDTRAWYLDAKLIDQTYKITGFPTILIFNKKSRLIGRIAGYRDPKGLKENLKQITEVFEPMYEKYMRGKRDSAFVFELVNETEKAGHAELANTIAQDYINNVSEKDLLLYHNLSFMFTYTKKTIDRGFQFFRKNAMVTDSLLHFKTSGASKRFTDKIAYEEALATFEKDKIDWQIAEQRLSKNFGGIDPEYYYGRRMLYASQHKIWQDFGKYYALYFKTAYSHSSYHINNMSWDVFEHVSDPKVLEVAIKTMKYNNENFDKDDPYTIDTYARLLFKVGRKKEALAAMEHAVRFAAGDDQFEKTLKQMRFTPKK